MPQADRNETAVEFQPFVGAEVDVAPFLDLGEEPGLDLVLVRFLFFLFFVFLMLLFEMVN